MLLGGTSFAPGVRCRYVLNPTTQMFSAGNCNLMKATLDGKDTNQASHLEEGKSYDGDVTWSVSELRM